MRQILTRLVGRRADRVAPAGLSRSVVVFVVSLSATGCCWLNPYVGGAGTTAQPFLAYRKEQVVTSPVIVTLKPTKERYFTHVDGCSIPKHVTVLALPPGEHEIGVAQPSGYTTENIITGTRGFRSLTAKGSGFDEFVAGTAYGVSVSEEEADGPALVFGPNKYVKSLNVSFFRQTP